MRTYITILPLVAFAAGLGVATAYRMSAEAMAVVVGVVCGMLACTIVCVTAIYAARFGALLMQHSPPPPPPPPAPMQQTQPMPQIIVVPSGLPALSQPQSQVPDRSQRAFKILGGE